MAKKKQVANHKRAPKVRIAAPKNRPLQVRYFCPTEKREVRLSVGSQDMKEAEQLKNEIEAKLLLGISVRSNQNKVRGPGMTWEEFREDYSQLHLKSVRDSSAKDAESRLDIATKIIKPKTLGEMAKPASLQRLQSGLLAGEHSRRRKPRSPHTVRGYMKSIVSALNWAYDQDWLVDRPKRPRIKVSKNSAMKGRPITEAEFKKMLDCTAAEVGDEAADSWKFILHGLWESALRIDELMHVSWDQPGTIRPKWTEGKLPVLEIPAPMQKNDTEEDIPLLPAFERLLVQVREKDRTGWVFDPLSLHLKLGRKVRHQRPDAEWVGKVISRIGQRAKVEVAPANPTTGVEIKFASAHDLRRSCGDRLRNAGVPPLVICRVMRHSSWETTRRHYAPGDVQKDAETLRRTLRNEASESEDNK
ncbi:hypothetical protein CEE69_15330 [Rhodopirellula bahusiensis]|uniref:Tyr recombinase domain-containing protein n=2 Tax=Rhodopirellula bahusiensis TaxID=2014065 RepID=A0A2G1W5T0_9BACT|nr:hypothetical protein CEE69_15330 [Rhodopirellula bahusiensis]